MHVAGACERNACRVAAKRAEWCPHCPEPKHEGEEKGVCFGKTGALACRSEKRVF